MSQAQAYTEEDAEADAFLLVSTCEDPMFGAKSDDAVSMHFEHLRLASFAEEATRVVLDGLSPLSLPQSNGNGSSSSSSSCVDESVIETEKIIKPKLGGERPLLLAVPEEFRTPLPKEANSPRSLRQAKLDCERDRFVVQGQHVQGVEVGFERLVAMIVEEIDKVCEEAALPLLTIDKRELAERVLIRSSRTNSGGASFSVLQSLVHRNKQQLVPLSNLALPLRIRISAGAIPPPSSSSPSPPPSPAAGGGGASSSSSSSSSSASSSSSRSSSSSSSSSKGSYGLVCSFDCCMFYNVRRVTSGEEEEEGLGYDASSPLTPSLTGPESFSVSVVYEDYVACACGSSSSIDGALVYGEGKLTITRQMTDEEHNYFG